MRVPSDQETITYFGSLGYQVKQVRLCSGNRGWKITGPDCPLDGRIFRTRLKLWAEWLDYSAETIHQVSLINSIMQLLASAEEQKRSALIAELSRWEHGKRSDLFSGMSIAAPGGDTDQLPRNWKALMRRILASRKAPLHFWGDMERSLREAGYKLPTGD